MRLKYDTNTQLIFQIGDPLDHATAGFLHNAMYDLANVNAVCVLAKIKKGELPQFIDTVKLLNANGFDITTPHKTDIIQYLDECDEASRIFNCVNHVKYRDGKLIGVGLDGVGMGRAIESTLGSVKNCRVLIVGAGAVAGPIGADLCDRGAKSITVVNRTLEKAKYITDNIKNMYEGVQTAYGLLDNDYITSIAPNIDIVVQCTSIGLPGHPGEFETLEFMSSFPSHCLVADVLYPNTTFLDVAREHNLKAINGMGMLLHQQIAMMDFRFGIKLPDSCLDIAEESLVAAVAMRELRSQRLEEEKK